MAQGDFGGYLTCLDREGRRPEKLEWDTKLWGGHAEAHCAFLLAYPLAGRQEFLDWFRKTDDCVFSRFDDPAHGEWFGYLHRSGDAALTLTGGKWKGLFRVPGALLTCLSILGELDQEACRGRDPANAAGDTRTSVDRPDATGGSLNGK